MEIEPHTVKTVVLLSLLRSSDGLSAFVSNADDADGSGQSCMPLAELPAALYPQRDALLADWNSLRKARQLEQAWPAFWRVFWSTVAATPEQAPMAMPQNVAHAARPSATAAHPRAFRGTKFQPPKPAAAALDLCAWLGDSRLLDGFFARHDFSHLPPLDKDGAPLPGHGGTLPAPTVSAMLAHEAGVAIGQMPILPEAFRRAFLGRLRTRPMSQLLAWLQIWRGLDSAAGQALAAHLCALEPDSHDWAALALNLPPGRQLVFLKALLAQQSYALPFGALSATQLIALDADTSDDQRFGLYLDAVLSNLRSGVSAAYTLCGCTLAKRVTAPYELERLDSQLRATKDCAAVPMADIYRMSNAVGADRSFWELTTWETCSLLPGFDRVLRETCWEKLGADVADHWLALFRSITWDAYQDDKIDKRWRTFESLFPKWHAGLIARSGAWQEKYVRMLRSYVNGWDDCDSLRRSVPYLLPLQQRLCHPPFSSAIDGDCVLSRLAVNLSVEGWQQLAATGDRTWLIAENACRRDNDTGLTGRGLYSLTQRWPAFLMHALATVPRRLMRTARLLGCLAYERRIQFLNEASHTVWFATQWTELDPYEACRQLSRLCLDTGVDSPVPRRLRDHFEGRTVLSGKQLERHCQVSMARLPATLLAALENKIWSTIDAPFKLRTRSTAASHAVRLLAGLDRGNRKGLRRFLLDYCDGRTDTYLDHPRNRAWFARHPCIDANTWHSNPPAAEPGGAAPFQLALEADPLEILMLGTYVGSCLGLGGLCEYSAVACLLDANKQVVYARDASGRVLARQLLAIDERDRLVCFAVYPVTASAALVSAFHAFDHAMAKAMGIPVYRNQDRADSYDIAVILAQEWWDDGVWDLDHSPK